MASLQANTEGGPVPSAQTFAFLELVCYESKFYFDKWRRGRCEDVSLLASVVRTVAALRGGLVCPEGVGTGRWGHISHQSSCPLHHHSPPQIWRTRANILPLDQLQASFSLWKKSFLVALVRSVWKSGIEGRMVKGEREGENPHVGEEDSNNNTRQ